ncbi:MAG TPA: extracellular solute-binding protein [Capillimicrobium sp.]|nr:extracellular solute-binding protein [Capillimicrobium sp.]
MRRDLWVGRARAAVGRPGRRFAALTLAAAAVAVGAVGCGGSDNDDEGAATSTAAATAASTAAAESNLSGTLKVAFPATAQPGWQKVIDDFEAANPDVSVEATFAPFASFFQLVSTQLQSGAGPDVIYTPPGASLPLSIQNMAADGRIQTLDDRPWAQDIPEELKSLVSRDGKLYGLVNGVFTGFLLTNDEKFAELGLEPPTTMDELLGMCKTAADAGLIPVAIGGGFPPDLSNLLSLLTANYVDGPDPEWIQRRNNDETTFAESEGWRTALQRIVDLKEAGCFERGVSGASREAATAAFASGKALMYPVLQPQLPAVVAAEPKFEWSVVPLPGDGPDTTYLAITVDPIIAINSKSENPEVAEAFLDFVADPEESKVYNETQHTIAPAAFVEDSFPELLAPLASYLQPGGHNVITEPTYWKTPSTNGVLSTNLAGLLTGQKTVDEILAELDKTYGKQ